jgi:hypothetical protein
MYFRRMAATDGNGPSLALRNAEGTTIPFKGTRELAKVFVKIGDLEDHLRIAGTSKLPDTDFFSLPDRSFASWEFLFLHPKRSLAEERNDGICDVTRYVSVGRPDTALVNLSLGEQKSCDTLFKRYGQSEDDKDLVLTSHSLRHLQNTELFRLGVADTIISKRFNRRSVAQSYEYDHRSLAEELDQLELPVDVEIALGEKASTVAKMIQSGKASGPIVDAFKRIQISEGDAAAFERSNSSWPQLSRPRRPNHQRASAAQTRFSMPRSGLTACVRSWQLNREKSHFPMVRTSLFLAVRESWMDSENLEQPTSDLGSDPEMRQVLDDLLARDEDITARAVARLHPLINAASTITRSKDRSCLLAKYQERQAEFRRWRGRPSKLAGVVAASALADRDVRIAELESQVALLTASHVAMIRAVGELGGFSRWAQFYESYSGARDQLAQLGALPEAEVKPLSARKRK